MTEATVSEPVSEPVAARAVIRWHLWGLLALTCVSGFLCFNRLSYPPMLIDECFTYWRVCGNLNQLLDTLRNDAFTPLHYELLNWIGQGFPLGGGVRLVPGGILLTPTVMRFVPALCGTLMTPVMYFLARQFFIRRTALIAAAFITFSAYGLFFSRNAKMYAPAWMLMTLGIACFLWWLRTWTGLAWLCWIGATIAAAGFHAITLLMIPLLPLFFVSVGKFRGSRILLLILGLVIILAGPALYYGFFNRWTQNSGGVLPGVVGEPAPDAKWQASGLNWVESIDDSVHWPILALNTYLSGYEWSSFGDLAEPAPFIEKYSGAMIALAATTFGLFFLGAVPWPYLRRVRDGDPPVQPWWRNLLWLSFWLVLPVYGFFYCRSVEGFSSPVVWLKVLLAGAYPYWPIAIGIALVFCLNRWPRIAKFVAIPLLVVAAAAIVQTARNHLDWMVYVGFPGSRFFILAIVPAVIFHYSGATFRQRGVELLRLVAVVGAVVILCGGACIVWRWLHEISMRKHPELPWQSIWHVRYVAIVWPAVWLAAAGLVGRLPTHFLRVAAVVVICSYNLANGLAREYAQTEVPFDRTLADIYLSQPHSNVRTYFDLRLMFNNTYFRPLVLYNACITAGLHPTPTEFRVGNSWPFEYGTVANDFRSRCIYNSSISSQQIHRDTSDYPEVNRVIVWELDLPHAGSWLFGDPVRNALGSGWELKYDEKIISRWYWTWTKEWTFHRREFWRK